jgi:hypothetical protein
MWVETRVVPLTETRAGDKRRRHLREREGDGFLGPVFFGGVRVKDDSAFVCKHCRAAVLPCLAQVGRLRRQFVIH